jgi:hypothetical protein
MSGRLACGLMKRAAAVLALLLMSSGCGAGNGNGTRLTAADRAACARTTPVRKAIVHLRNFDVYGFGVLTSRVATDPLYPQYPDALLPEKVAIAPRQRRDAPVKITAFYCADGSVIRLFQPSACHANLDLPRPSPAPAVAKAGVTSVLLVWPPPFQSLGDPDRWFVTPLDYKPGIAVWRFSQGERVLDRLTVRVCIGNAFGHCAKG